MNSYVKHRTRKDVDGELLYSSVVYELGKKPKRFQQIIFINK